MWHEKYSSFLGMLSLCERVRGCDERETERVSVMLDEISPFFERGEAGVGCEPQPGV